MPRKEIVMKPYSVLLLYPDYMQDQGLETYYAHVEAMNPRIAVSRARQLAVAANTDEHGCNVENPGDFALLIILAGHHEAELSVYDHV